MSFVKGTAYLAAASIRPYVPLEMNSALAAEGTTPNSTYSSDKAALRG